MSQKAIPYLFLRGGSSRGPYFRRSDLPEDRDQLAEVLMAVVGAGHPLNIDGIGGGNAVTTKVAMLSKSERDGCDVDYFFAQVAVDKREVDYRPTCGNILCGVGPAALEMGIVPITGDETTVRIHAVNTGAVIDAVIQTPDGRVSYEGDTEIAGVPGTSAPVRLAFMGTVGSVTGALFPTGNKIDVIDGIEVTCMDVAMPVMMARADAFGLTGRETVEELDANRAFYDKVEAIRLKAGELMGLGDVTKSVTPKIAILGEPSLGGTIGSRYFMPWACHPSMAVTGGQCIAACAITPGTVADGLAQGIEGKGTPLMIGVEHPAGILEVLIDFDRKDGEVEIKSAGLERSARLIAKGDVMVPAKIFEGF